MNVIQPAQPNPNAVRYVLGFVFRSGFSHVLLLRKRRPEWQAGRLNGVGGRIEPGEVPSETMRRECAEETGLVIANWTHFATLHTSFRVLEEVYCFHAVADADVFDTARALEDQAVETSHVPSLSNDCLANVPWLVQMAIAHARRRHVTPLAHHDVWEVGRP